MARNCLRYSSRAEATLLNFHCEKVSSTTFQMHIQPSSQVKILTSPFFVCFLLFIIVTPSFSEGTFFAHSFYKFPIKVGKPIIKITFLWLIMAIVITNSDHIVGVLDVTRYVLDRFHFPSGIYTYIPCKSYHHYRLNLNLYRSKHYHNLHHINVL